MDNDIKKALTDAVRYWEKKRIMYNAVLVLIVMGYFIYYLPGSWESLELDKFLSLFMLAMVANFLYSFAYIADVFVQLTDFATIWRKKRWIVFVLGLIFASIWVRFIVIDAFL